MVQAAGDGARRKDPLLVAIDRLQSAEKRGKAKRMETDRIRWRQAVIQYAMAAVMAVLVGLIMHIVQGSSDDNLRSVGVASAITFLLACAFVFIRNSSPLHSGSSQRRPSLVARSPSVSFSRPSVEPLPDAASRFVGTWCVLSVEEGPGLYDAYLKQLGVNWALRRLAAGLKPEPTYSIEGGELHMRTPGPGGIESHDIFTTGREKTITMMGRDVEVVYTWEDESKALVASMCSPELANGAPVEIRRWITDEDILMLKSSCGGFSCTRTYARKQQ